MAEPPPHFYGGTTLLAELIAFFAADITYTAVGSERDCIFSYGAPKTVSEYALRAQLVQYRQYKSLFEGFQQAGTGHLFLCPIQELLTLFFRPVAYVRMVFCCASVEIRWVVG